MSTTTFDVEAVRRRFSSLRGDFVFLDAPGGSQVPDEVGDAIAKALREASANLNAPYATSRRAGEILTGARAAAGRFLGCGADEVMFGANMTSLNFMLSRTASREWKAGDEVIVTRLDHDGNVAPWLEVAHDRDLVVRLCDVTPEGRLDLDDLSRLLGPRTRVVAFACASNAIGTVTDVRRVTDLVREAGAISWADAVHFAAHEPIDVAAFGVDVLLCSPYKFCGPHLGMAFGRAELMETWRPYKTRVWSTTPVARSFETGTSPYELLAGFEATIAYLDSLGGTESLREYERGLGARMLDGFSDDITLYGVQTMEGRVPTFLINVDGIAAVDAANTLCAQGFGVWARTSYSSVGLHERLGWGEAIRVGLAHYNTEDEVDRFLAALTALG